MPIFVLEIESRRKPDDIAKTLVRALHALDLKGRVTQAVVKQTSALVRVADTFSVGTETMKDVEEQKP